ncbi:TPA: hypothetical protein DCY43_03340 [candidate division WWE3 bacterium]|uniref:Polymerase nucleotidyl transferase domain-containing protein n=1 Tax=candidate division WWE3 bacterium TaxID=2053526 RepID=A0A351JTX9_UNCKA|nr:hypothetical protein [candidate division WWE3 bacterium]
MRHQKISTLHQIGHFVADGSGRTGDFIPLDYGLGANRNRTFKVLLNNGFQQFNLSVGEIKRHLITFNIRVITVSRARGDAKPGSDVDLLVKFNKVVSLFDLARAENALEDRLRLPVDLVMENSLKPSLRPYIEKDLKVIYAEN